MTLALVLFAVAAVVGITMAAVRFRGKPYPSMTVALVHGIAAAAGLIALIVAVQKPGASLATSALVVFLVAAAGGFVLFFRHLRKLALPIWLVLVHAVVAVAAFVTLLVSVTGT
jgi:hypothetical protein